jgi:hypothetical protein
VQTAGLFLFLITSGSTKRNGVLFVYIE